MSVAQAVMEIPAAHQLNVFGQFDCNIKKIERAFGVTFVNRGETIRLSGTEEAVGKARSVVDTLLELSRRGNTVTEQNVDYTISMSFSEKSSDVLEIDKEIICRTISGKPVKPKTVGQKKYVDEIRNKMIVFGVGPAGTGKTYLAMAMAIDAFKKQEVSRIILTRPAIEAGEKLGFLPGDLQSKIDPYLRPLYDALYQIMGAESFINNQEKGLIEVAPLAYMRGRTLDNSYIILDEAQNTTPAQMKMFLTRIGFGSKVIITGDMTQKDLPAGTPSGLDVAIKVLKNVDDIGFVYLDNRDVVRHPLVQKIVKAYEEYENKQNSKMRAKEHAEKTDAVRPEKTRKAEVNVLLTNNEEIHKINKEYRGIDRPTDVLSFPMVDYDKPANFDPLEDASEDYFNFETGELVLGDIIISVDKVYEQAESYGHSLERELGFLVAHSMLHLFGYDHMEEEEREQMEARQREILNGLSILR